MPRGGARAGAGRPPDRRVGLDAETARKLRELAKQEGTTPREYIRKLIEREEVMPREPGQDPYPR